MLRKEGKGGRIENGVSHPEVLGFLFYTLLSQQKELLILPLGHCGD